MNKLLSDDLDQVKKSIRMTNTEEMAAEIKLYQKECQRLRKLMIKEMKQGEKAVMALSN